MKILQKRQAAEIDLAVAYSVTKRRKQYGITKKKLSEALGVSVQQITKYEKGTNRISSGMLFKYSQVFNNSVDYFFYSIVDKPRFPSKEDESHSWRNNVIMQLIKSWDV